MGNDWELEKGFLTLAAKSIYKEGEELQVDSEASGITRAPSSFSFRLPCLVYSQARSVQVCKSV